MCSAILNCLLSRMSFKFSNQLAASEIDFSVTSLICKPLIFTQRASSFNLCPLHLSHLVSD